MSVAIKKHLRWSLTIFAIVFLIPILFLIYRNYQTEADLTSMTQERQDLQEKYYDLAEAKVDLSQLNNSSVKATVKFAFDIYDCEDDWRIIPAIMTLEHHGRHTDESGKVLRVRSRKHKGMEFVGVGSLLLKQGQVHIDGVNIEKYNGHVFYLAHRYIELRKLRGSVRGALLAYSNDSPTYPDRIFRLAGRIRQ